MKKNVFWVVFLCTVFVVSGCSARGGKGDHKIAPVFDECIALSKTAITVTTKETEPLALEAKLAADILNYATLEWEVTDDDIIEIEYTESIQKINIVVKGVRGSALVIAKLIPHDIESFGEETELEARCIVNVAEYVPAY